MTLKCVIFDIDGTLSETGNLIFDSFNHIAERYRGRRYTEDEIIRMFGPPEDVALLNIVGPEAIDKAMGEYLQYYRAHHAERARLHPGMREVLDFLKRRRCKLAIFTGKGTQTTRITLEELGIAGFFDYVVTGNDVTNHKPSPEGIRKILTEFNLKPEEALMIGDGVGDVKASHEAGVRIGLVLWDSYAKQRVQDLRPDYVFRTVRELEEWVGTNLG
ncbi:MAG TPA: HAD-IA family hydrolase [Bacteroidota bacterium]|nr:HAD-IA family hydrolase [Bacteroidota bacterium]